MGNSVTCSILLNDPEEGERHAAGSTLSGRIMVKVGRKIKGAPITLVAKGKEKASVKAGKQTKYSTRVFFQSRIILNNLNNNKVNVDRGSYSFPFSIQLPDSLPSSFECGKHSANSCSIQYKCVASIGNIETTHKAFQESEPVFQVSSMPSQDVRVPCFLEPKTEKITSMGVVSKGSITFGVGVDDTHVGKGQELVLSVACRNDTSIDIERVCVRLVERITWSADSIQQRDRKVDLVPRTELDLPGLIVRRKSAEAIQQDKRVGLDALRQSNRDLIYEELSSGRNSIRIQIPAHASDTYNGTLLSISHYIKLYLKTPPLVADIEEKIPLRIGYPPQEQRATRVDIPAAQRPTADGGASSIAAASSIPFASAVPVPANTVEAPVATASAEAIVLGGTTTSYDTSLTSTSNIELADLIPLPPPQVPSLAVLLEEMTASVNDFDIISSKLRNNDWRPIISALSPADYGAIIAHVCMEFDQPRVAELLAPHVGGSNGFTCAYCSSALENAAQWNRTAMVQKLLPLCVDVRAGFTMLQEELSPWEKTITAREFQVALDHSDR